MATMWAVCLVEKMAEPLVDWLVGNLVVNLAEWKVVQTAEWTAE